MEKFTQSTPNGHVTYHYRTSHLHNKPQTDPNKSFFQFTTECFPRSEKLFHRSKIPFGVFIQPFASMLHVNPYDIYLRQTIFHSRMSQYLLFLNIKRISDVFNAELLQILTLSSLKKVNITFVIFVGIKTKPHQIIFLIMR